MKDVEDIILWPDDVWCYRYQMADHTYKSDDYVVLEYGTTSWNNFLKEEGYAE